MKFCFTFKTLLHIKTGKFFQDFYEPSLPFLDEIVLDIKTKHVRMNTSWYVKQFKMY